VTEILVSRRQALEDLAELLIDKEMIERRQVQATLNKRSLDDAA
jgi:ATP-dependent Zn protease